MATILFLLFAVLMAADADAGPATEPGGHQWQPTDMNPTTARMVEVDLLPGSSNCDADECAFNLHVFPGDGYNHDEKRYILFIPGGPGQIVDRHRRDLKQLESDYNIIYFDVRGSGLSLIPKSNLYDKFLRAEYVVEDIETIRRALRIETWAAVYAHSWGTIVAQQYAEKSENMSQRNGGGTGRVIERLILSAPVARAHKNTEEDRRAMLIANLKDIYRNYSKNVNRCSTFFGKIMKDIVATIQQAKQGIIQRRVKPRDVGRTDDFCFLNSQTVEDTEAKLSKVLKTLDDDYGSVGFVLANYEKLVGTEENDFIRKFPYPKEFYAALQRLQFMGGSEQPRLPNDDSTRRRKYHAALLLGYYLTLPDEAFENTNHELNPKNKEHFGCNKSAPLLTGLPVIKDPSVLKVLRDNGEEDPELYWPTKFCGEVIEAAAELSVKQAESESERARDVFSVYDGISRSTFETLRKHSRLDENDCYRGKDIRDVANGDLEVNEGLAAVAKRLGMELSAEICPWAPAQHRHSTPTLILKGGGDPVIAGGQAEEVFENALTGKRILIEFPGVGHGGILSRITIEEQEMSGQEIVAELVKEFLEPSDEDIGQRQRQIHKKLHSVINTINPGT
jgi:pimeloyl-ACP methyl ester carboxylesterase